MKITTTTLLLLLFSISVYSQRTVSGFIRDSKTGENLIGATVYDLTSKAGTASNTFGRYSLQVKSDSAKLIFSYVGYQRAALSFKINKDTTININLQEAALLEEVVVNATRAENIQESSSMSTFTIPIEQIKSLPTIFGERDLIKVLQLLPGVNSGSEGSSGLYVRGGGPDQNLVLLDGAPIYNASHLYGFFSTFNSDAINHVELVKGGFPARYGGRLSSVVDIIMKEGNQEKIKGRGSIGIISSKILLEGPIGKRTTFLFSGRRSYLNLLQSKLISKQSEGVSDKYYMFDLNGRVNFRVNKNNRIFLSSYVGGDHSSSGVRDLLEDDNLRYEMNMDSKLGWGNTLVTLRWNHVYGSKLFSNVTTTYSKYRFNTAVDIQQFATKKPGGVTEERYYKYDYSSAIEDYAAKIDFDYVPNTKNYIRFGTGVTNHKFSPGILAIGSTDQIEGGSYSSNNVTANEAFAYIEDDLQITSKLKVNIGVHGAGFFVDNKTYLSLQPRISGRYLVNDKLSVKGSYATMTQFVHLLTNAGVGLPTDLWVPSNGTIKPQQSQQWALGAATTLNNDFEISIEGYYKDMQNVIEYKDGATYLSVNQNWQNKVEVGKGNSYGAEVFIQKKVGKFNGWVGYTLSWNNRQFDNLNHGNWFPYRYDRRHDVKIAGTWHVTDKLELGAVWVYSSGNAVTIPLVAYAGAENDNVFYGVPNVINLYGGAVYYTDERNNYRMRSYHRMDLSATYTIRRPRVSHEFNLSVYNAYARNNPYYLKFNYRFENGVSRRVLEQVSLISLVPSISYSITF